LTIQDYKKIAMAVDFSETDEKVISYGLKQAAPETTFLLIHVVESAGAKILGHYAADAETVKDEEQLNVYKLQLESMRHSVEAKLGYRSRTKEITRICKEEQVDLLILGAHGHKGVFDFIYGQTIDSVRHQLDIPVLIVK
jgi:manganese transport protein